MIGAAHRNKSQNQFASPIHHCTNYALAPIESPYFSLVCYFNPQPYRYKGDFTSISLYGVNHSTSQFI
jgi:hypothetical protein